MASYSYDDYGRPDWLRTAHNVTRTDLGYDNTGRLSSLSHTVIGAEYVLVLSYDPMGRLQQLTIGDQTTEFLYDGDNLIGGYGAIA